MQDVHTMRQGSMQHARPCTAVPVLPGSHHAPPSHCASCMKRPVVSLPQRRTGSFPQVSCRIGWPNFRILGPHSDAMRSWVSRPPSVASESLSQQICMESLHIVRRDSSTHMSEHPEKVSADQRNSMSTDCKDLQCSQGCYSTKCIA